MSKKEIDFPLYASPECRSINKPSVLLTATQTKALLRRVRQHHGLSESVSGMRETITNLCMHLINLGWQRVELHGEQLLLTAVVYHSDLSRNLIDSYIQSAKASGIWSLNDYLKWGRAPLRSVDGPRTPVKHKSFPDDDQHE